MESNELTHDERLRLEALVQANVYHQLREAGPAVLVETADAFAAFLRGETARASV